MRELLKEREGLRGQFTAIFVRYGKKPQYKGRPRVTLLFRDVCDVHGRCVTDHLWFVECLGWAKLELTPGEKVTFEARVGNYLKGYLGRDDFRREEAPPRIDYRLSRPSNIRRHVRVEEAAELKLQ